MNIWSTRKIRYEASKGAPLQKHKVFGSEISGLDRIFGGIGRRLRHQLHPTNPITKLGVRFKVRGSSGLDGEHRVGDLTRRRRHHQVLGHLAPGVELPSRGYQEPDAG